MKYSVIIPCYDATEEDFRRCLDSIKNQTIKPYEVICVDDCSPVDTPKIALEYGFTYIRHNINKQNGGARNTGIRNATGDYLIFCNSDDWFELTTIEEIEKVNRGQDVIMCGFETFGTVYYSFIPQNHLFSNFGYYGEPMHICNRKFLLDNNIWQKENYVCADKPWVEELEEKMQTWAIISKPLYKYQVGHDTSLLNKISKGEVDENGKVVNNNSIL